MYPKIFLIRSISDFWGENECIKVLVYRVLVCKGVHKRRYLLYVVIYLEGANIHYHTSMLSNLAAAKLSPMFPKKSLSQPLKSLPEKLMNIHGTALMCFTFPALDFEEKNCFDQLAQPRESWESTNCFLQYHRNLKIVGPTTMVLLQPTNLGWLVHWRSTLYHRHFVGLEFGTGIDTPCFVVPRHVASRNIVACNYVFGNNNTYTKTNNRGVRNKLDCFFFPNEKCDDSFTSHWLTFVSNHLIVVVANHPSFARHRPPMVHCCCCCCCCCCCFLAVAAATF